MRAAPLRSMPAVDRAHRVSTRVLGAITFLIGLAMIVTTLAAGGGPAAVGVLAGAGFAILGGVRYATAAPPDGQ